MQRYAVLLDLHDPDLRPIALVTEHDDSVRVHFAIDCGLRSLYHEPYAVTEPDGTTVRYEPGDTEYFASVMNTLARGFVVNELESVARIDLPTITELYAHKIVLPRTRRRVRYAAAGTGYAYAQDGPPLEAISSRAVSATESSLCVAA